VHSDASGPSKVDTLFNKKRIGTRYAERQGLIGAQPNDRSDARWLTGDGAMERGACGESILGLTGARAAVWRPGGGGKEVAVVALDAGSAWAREEEKESGRRCSGGRWALPFYRGRGGAMVKVEEWPVLMG
jgi:hypothetical protein